MFEDASGNTVNHMFDIETGDVLFRANVYENRNTRYETINQPFNVTDALNTIGGHELYKKIELIHKNITGLDSLPLPSDYDNELAVCSSCWFLSTDTVECNNCGATIASRNDITSFEVFENSYLQSRDNKADQYLDNRGKLIELSNDGKIKFSLDRWRIQFSFPDIHFREPSGHRFTSILNKEMFDSFCVTLPI